MSHSDKKKDDFTCPICMYIMIHPVTMPCNHSLCMMCYKQCVEKASLACPICRLRISVWARKSAKANTLIDQVMWETIQRLFPIEVRNHIEGNDDSTDDNWDSPRAIEIRLRKLKELSEPGEIKEEYEAALAKLERQRKEEAKREEEASAALIRALQAEDEEELAKLAKQREEHERLGRQAAEQIFRETHAGHPGQRLRDGARTNKDSKKRCESASMKLDSFYASYRKSSQSAPPHSEFATTLSSSQGKRETHHLGSRDDYSPYPYHCISPSEKQKTTPNLPSETPVSDEVNEASGVYVRDHSYTSASAGMIDLTLKDEMTEWASVLREDVQHYIKVEPPDLEDPLDAGVASSSFQPICSSQQTPPKKLPSGEIVDPVLIRSIPRNLTSCFGDSDRKQAVSPSVSSCSSEIFPDQSTESRNVGSEFHDDIGCRKNTKSSSVSFFDYLNSGGSDNEFVEKMKLTRKIVYGTSKPKKHCTTSTMGLPLLCASGNSSSVSTKTVSVPGNDLHLKFPFKPTSIDKRSSLDTDGNRSKCDRNVSDTMHDYFMSSDSRLLIPLESELETSRLPSTAHNVNNTERPKAVKTKTITRKAVVGQKKVSKSMDHPSCSSIRDWCLKNKRKADSNGNFDFSISSEDQNDMSEDADHQFALELQRLYDQQDKLNVKVDRFQGSSNEYSFRKKRRLR